MQAQHGKRDDGDNDIMSEESPNHSEMAFVASVSATTATSRRLHGGTEAEKLERRRISNRKSARRRRLQEQEEVQGLEKQIQYLTQANHQLKSEQMNLEQTLQVAFDLIRKNESNSTLPPPPSNSQQHVSPDDCKLPPSYGNKISSSRQDALGVATLSTLLVDSNDDFFPFQSSAGAVTAVTQHPITPLARVQNDVASAQYPSQWSDNMAQQRDSTAFQTGSSVPPTSGEDMLAAIVRGINQSEANMYELMSPWTASSGSGSMLIPIQDSQASAGNFGSAWTVLPPPQLLDNRPSTFSEPQKFWNSASSQELTESFSPAAFPQHYSQFPSPHEKQVPMTTGRTRGDGSAMESHLKSFQDLTDGEYLDSIEPTSFAFLFDQTSGGPPATSCPIECDVSDGDSCHSVDIDRFLALDLQVGDDFKWLASPKPDET